jgi:hypothetical protein
MDGRRALGADVVIPALALGFTLYFLYSVSGLEWEAKANGVIVGTMLLVLVGAQFVRVGLAMARGRGRLDFSALFTPREALPKRVGMLAITIAFVACVPWAGLGLGLFVALAAAFVVMGVRGAKHVLVVSLLVAAASSLLFTVALDSSLPRGPVEDVLFRLLR